MKDKIYKVNKVSEPILELTGHTISTHYSTLNTVTDFISPWDNTPIEPIVFKAFYDTHYFYFSFQVKDNEVYTELEDNTNASINKSDRVELFFRENYNLTPYYCLEIDSKARLMDFKALPKQNFNFDWNWDKTEIEIKSFTAKNEFFVEGKISLKSLADLNILKQDHLGKYMEVGLYRAKYILNNQNKRTPIWITWVNPNCPTPDFHNSSSFGVFRFSE
ncbi:endoxylanase [Formosa sediminum]|uniref:Endoxylanase n=1 Tax=Formosa sediminum TaxID=2594004 RepID=A0A516GUM8_9FLAO|nr:sugar-binding protein [Formosa sediminum]QDO95222.1 endoxylanase [Formosa sediminum]